MTCPVGSHTGDGPELLLESYYMPSNSGMTTVYHTSTSLWTFDVLTAPQGDCSP